MSALIFFCPSSCCLLLKCSANPGAYQDLGRRPSLVLMVALNLVENRLLFTSKWSTAWHHGVKETSLNTPLQLVHCQIAVQEERPSLETPT